MNAELAATIAQALRAIATYCEAQAGTEAILRQRLVAALGGELQAKKILEVLSALACCCPKGADGFRAIHPDCRIHKPGGLDEVREQSGLVVTITPKQAHVLGLGAKPVIDEEAGRAAPSSRTRKRQARRGIARRWSRKADACTACGLNDRPHLAKGLCGRCYWNRKKKEARTKG